MIMSFLSNGLRDAFEGQGDAGFFAWTYASFDRLEEILRPGYFNGAYRLAHLWDAYRPIGLHEASDGAYRPVGLHEASDGAYRPVGLHEAVMVRGRNADGQMRVRLVQDDGRPDDPDAPLAKPRRGRGRPAKAVAE